MLIVLYTCNAPSPINRYTTVGLGYQDFLADNDGNGTSVAAFLEAARVTGVATNMNISGAASTVLSATKHVSTYVLPVHVLLLLILMLVVVASVMFCWWR